MGSPCRIRWLAIVLAIGALLSVSIGLPALSAEGRVADPNDTEGPLDVRSVRHFERGGKIVHVIRMFEAWDNSVFAQDGLTRKRAGGFYLGLYLDPSWWYGWEYSIEVLADCLYFEAVDVELPDCELYARMSPGNEDHYDAPWREPKVWRVDDRTMALSFPRKWLNFYDETTSYYYSVTTTFESSRYPECPPRQQGGSIVCVDDAPENAAVHRLSRD